MENPRELLSEWADFIETSNEDAYYILYDHYHDYLLYIATQKGVDIDSAKDHVNDLFLYIFEKRAKLSHIKNHHNYIVTCFIRRLFHKDHFNNLVPIMIEEHTLFDDKMEISIDTFKYYCEDQISNALNTCIKKLSHNQAKMIYQKFYLGLTYEVIAQSHGVPVKTVYNTIFRATTKLKKLLEGRQFSQIKAAMFSVSTFFF